MVFFKLGERERVDSETRTKAENEKGRMRVPLLGGADGNRTRVQKPFNITFSVGS